MTDINNAPLLPEPPMRQFDNRGPKGMSRWTRSLLVVGVLGGGLALGLGSLALAEGAFDRADWRRGMRLAMIQHVVAHALNSVGASAAQEEKVHDIIATNFAQIAPDPKEHEAFRKQALDLLSAPTIDRAALEKLRADAVANFDAKSKKFVNGVLDIADQLTPAQRVELAGRIEQMAQRRMMMGGEHGGRFMEGGPRSYEDGQGGPDSGPNKE